MSKITKTAQADSLDRRAAAADAAKAGTALGAVAQCWALWDGIAGGEPLPRSMMVDLAVAEGVNYWTARTQAQRWLTARKAA